MSSPTLHTRLFATLVIGATLAQANPKIEDVVVGPAGAGGLYVVSQNQARIAYVGAKGTRTVVSVDGVEGPVLDELIGGSAAIISGAGRVLVHSANSGGKFNGTPSAVIFSDDGAHYAYIGGRGTTILSFMTARKSGAVRGPRCHSNTAPLGCLQRGSTLIGAR